MINVDSDDAGKVTANNIMNCEFPVRINKVSVYLAINTSFILVVSTSGSPVKCSN